MPSHMRPLADLARLRANLRFTTDPKFAAGMLAHAETVARADALREFLADHPLLAGLGLDERTEH